MSYGNKFNFLPNLFQRTRSQRRKISFERSARQRYRYGEDFKEREPTIGKNWLPIPIINFSPKNPVKGVKVKFDASSSTDPDGEIVEFFGKLESKSSLYWHNN